MAYTVKAYALEKINLAPEDTTEEVLQNVAVILSTPKFSDSGGAVNLDFGGTRSDRGIRAAGRGGKRDL